MIQCVRRNACGITYDVRMSATTQAIHFVERHGYALLFWWVLAEQGAVPLPSIPLLLAAGALARSGRLRLAVAIACCVAGALLADNIWFQFGRRRGTRVLRFLCRVALEPDSCVRQTENAFLKYGLKCLLFSKFVPGLNAVAAPLAGNSGVSVVRFLAFDILGAIAWSAAYIVTGYVFSNQLELALDYASRMGSGLVVLVVGLFAAWIGWKYLQRKRFMKQLDTARITPEELRDRLEAGQDLFIVDLRSGLEDQPSSIPGALRISAAELNERAAEIPRDREIILFCS
jgi:membrane protein DedA with SNARE-associated domain